MGDVRESNVFRMLKEVSPLIALQLYAEDQRDEELQVNWDSNSLGGAFVWDKSEKGHTYWSNISYDISCRRNQEDELCLRFY